MLGAARGRLGMLGKARDCQLGAARGDRGFKGLAGQLHQADASRGSQLHSKPAGQPNAHSTRRGYINHAWYAYSLRLANLLQPVARGHEQCVAFSVSFFWAKRRLDPYRDHVCVPRTRG